MKIMPVHKKLCLGESKNGVLVRSQERQTSRGEVFTPTELALEILEQMPESIWDDGKNLSRSNLW